MSKDRSPGGEPEFESVSSPWSKEEFRDATSLARGSVRPEAEARGRKAGYVLAWTEHVCKHVLGLTDFGVVCTKLAEREK